MGPAFPDSKDFSSLRDRAVLAWRDRAVAGLARLAGRGFDLLLPPTCPVSGEAVAAPGLLSAAGWAALRFIDDPVCARCGAPFAHDHGAGAACAACIAEPPAFDAARAALVYDEASHRLIVGFKHADRTELAPLLGRLVARAGAPLLRAQTILVPAPLHPRRLMARRYNHAGLIAGEVSRLAGARIVWDALKRTRATPPQKTLSARRRKRNVLGAFAAPDHRKALLAGAHVIVIDDVLTTGATLSACARALKKAGAARVDALVAARVARAGVEAI